MSTPPPSIGPATPSQSVVKSEADDDDESIVWVGDDEEDTGNSLELPCEQDNTLLMATLQSSFAGATGLKYRNPKTKAWRAIKVANSDGKALCPPAAGWAGTFYMVIRPDLSSLSMNAADSQDDDDAAVRAKRKHPGDRPYGKATKGNDGTRIKDCEIDIEEHPCQDLLIMSLPYEATNEELRNVFSPFGELVFVEHKKDHTTNKPRGFGFMRFADIDAQKQVLRQSFFEIGGRRCQVKIPYDKVRNSQQAVEGTGSTRLFIGRITEAMTTEILEEAFESEAQKIDLAGHVKEVYIPRPFRSFAFVTFNSREIARRLLLKKTFFVGENSVFVNPAEQKRIEGETGGSVASYGYGGNYASQFQQQAYGYGVHPHHQAAAYTQIDSKSWGAAAQQYAAAQSQAHPSTSTAGVWQAPPPQFQQQPGASYSHGGWSTAPRQPPMPILDAIIKKPASDVLQNEPPSKRSSASLTQDMDSLNLNIRSNMHKFDPSMIAAWNAFLTAAMQKKPEATAAGVPQNLNDSKTD